jgi:hypothetical protein
MTENNEEFFGDDLPETTDNNNTARVISTFKELMEAQEQFDQVTELAEGLKAKIGKIKTDTFPDLLREMGTEIWRDPETGITVELETSVNASLPKDREKRNEILHALRPLGIDEILGEEFNVTFIPNDVRSPVLRRLLGIPEPVEELIEDDSAPTASPKLTNMQIDAIEQFREAFALGEMPAEEKLGVHASRLGAWLRKKINDGKGAEVTAAGIWHGKKAEVKKPKQKGAKA